MPKANKVTSDPVTALTVDERELLATAKTIQGMTDLDRVNRVFEENNWCLERKILILVGIASMWQEKPNVAITAIKALDQTSQDAIRKAGFMPKEIPEQQAPDEDSLPADFGMPDPKTVSQLEETTRTLRLHFKETSDDEKENRKEIDSEVTDTHAGRDVEGAEQHDSGGSAEPSPGDGDFESDAHDDGYYADDREDGRIHRPPTSLGRRKAGL